MRNIRLNNLNNIVPIHAAVCAQKGTVKLFCSAQGGFHSLLPDRPRVGSRYELARALTLQDIFDEHGIARCNLLKLDCEGGEYDILYTLPSAYYARIDKVVMEYHGELDESKRRAQANALVAHLQRQGFCIHTYQDFVGFDCGFIKATRCGL